MTIQAPDDKWLARRNEWIDRVTRLVNEVEQWATAEGWAVHRDTKLIKERSTGDYNAPMLRMRSPQGEIFLTPIALHVLGADGRVDLEAWPTLNRVRLVGDAGNWQILTDSNVPVREPWNRETSYSLFTICRAVHESRRRVHTPGRRTR